MQQLQQLAGLQHRYACGWDADKSTKALAQAYQDQQ